MSPKNKRRRDKSNSKRRNSHVIWDQLTSLLATPVNGTSLAMMRIGVGIIMALEGYALIVPHDAAITSGTPLERYYTGSDISFHWPYEGLEWLPMLPRTVMYALVVLLIGAGITMALGLFYRLSAVLVFAIWAYFFGVESTRSYWQSHYYLELLTCFLIMWMPAARRFSVDAWRKNLPRDVPFWTIFLLRGQLVIAYFYAGVAKFHLDWFLDAVPVRWFLSDQNVTTPYEPYLTQAQLEALRSLLHSPQLAYFLSWTGAVFDVAVGFLLLFRRTRIFGLLLMLIFHITNHMFIFDDIGWFPILGAATALIFLDPDWPERLVQWLRCPKFAKPDKWWAIIGGVVFPIVGLSLGWSLKPTPRSENDKKFTLGKYVVPCIMAYLVWQSLLPLRHHFIDSDARITYEGFSFSWRLKADTRHAIGHSLRIVDSKVISASTLGRKRVNWDAWPHEPVVYRRVTGGRVIWPAMPELSVVLEPVFGERIIYNPYSGRKVGLPNSEAERRVRKLWEDMYGHPPTVVVPKSVSQAIVSIVESCRASSVAEKERGELELLTDDVEKFEKGLATTKEAGDTLRHVQTVIRTMLADEESSSVVRPIARTMYPLVLHGEPRRPEAFFIVEDEEVIVKEADGTTRVNRAKWEHGPGTRQPGIPFDEYVGLKPLIVYKGVLGSDVKQLLPVAYITDTHGNKSRPPIISWNSLRDMPASKFLHASGQAFYLRRYARRVASIWEEKCGRRPAVYARTAVSYNGRPHQELVDPDADLARVPVSWFSHNEWIRDLEMPRIPQSAVERKSSNYRTEKR